MKTNHALALAIALAAIEQSSALTVVLEDGHPNPNRFLDLPEFPESPLLNPNFIFSDLQLTGVGWSGYGRTKRSVTLVSPKHFVYANHYKLPVGTKVFFAATDGSIIERTILQNHFPLKTRSTSDQSDLALGELSAPIHSSTGVVQQPYLNNPTSLSNYEFYALPENGELIIFGQNQRAGTGTNFIPSGIPATRDRGNPGEYFNSPTPYEDYYTSFSSVYAAPGAARVQGGDSGSPTLANINGRTALLSTHTSTGFADFYYQISGQFIGNDLTIDSLNSILAEDGYQMTPFYPEAGELILQLEPSPVVGRMGEPLDLNVTLANIGEADVRNIKIEFSLGLESIGGSGWVDTSTDNLIEYSLAKIPVGDVSDLSLTLSALPAGRHEFDLTVYSDESETIRRTYSIDVIPEPGTIAFIIVGSALFAWRHKTPTPLWTH